MSRSTISRETSVSMDSQPWRSTRAESTSSFSSTTSTNRIRLAELAKQYGMGVHVENWREDATPIRQYLPLQHIIGSLKRDRDEKVLFRPEPEKEPKTPPRTLLRQYTEADISACSPKSDDSFLSLLRSPKRRRISDSSNADSDTDPDRRFSWQASTHVAKELPEAALPGLNHILNLATITTNERNILSEYAPKHLDDSQVLMTEVLALRERMGDVEGAIETVGLDDLEDDANVDPELLKLTEPIIPPERDEEVRTALKDFVAARRKGQYIAKI